MCVTPIYLLQKNPLHRFQKTSCTLVIDNSSTSHSQLQKKKLYPSRCFYERKKPNTEACFNIAKKINNYTTCNNYNNLIFYVISAHTVNHNSFMRENFPRYT